MINEKRLTVLAWILAMVLIGSLSAFVGAKYVPDTGVVERTVSNLDEAKDTVIKLSAATIALSVGITLLPDDWATPLADTLSDMSTYFVLILGVVFLEKQLIILGIPIAFTYLIPFACISVGLFMISKKKIFASLAYKVFILALAVILAVPCSTFISEKVCSEGLEYVNETISLAESEKDVVENISDVEQNDSFFETISAKFQTAVNGVKDLFDHFKMVVEKCVQSVAILLVAYCLIPVLTFLLIVAIVKQLFRIQGLQMLYDRLDPVNRIMRKENNESEKESGLTE